MPSERTSILRWTGRGSLEALQTAVEFVLGGEGVKARVFPIGDSVVVEGPEPIGVAALFGEMPGVAWVAAGLTARSHKELVSASLQLAKRYLRSGERFSVEAEGEGGAVAADVAGAVTSSILEGAKGSRVSVESPKVRFRAALEGERGVVGVQVKKGPGGSSMGKDKAGCFVSGGTHSSVLAWTAVLQGFRVRLVHAKYSEESLRAVARLYSELSHRADPRGLSVEVLEGDSVAGALADYAKRSKDPLFVGHSAGSGSRHQVPRALAPLYLQTEEKFISEMGALGINGFEGPEDWDRKGEGARRVRRFGGVRADVSDVLDGLK